MDRACWTLLVGLVLAAPAGAVGGPPPSDEPPLILLVRLDDVPVTPVIERVVHRALDEASEAGASCLLIVLDTPGGLVDSTRGIVRDVLDSRVPVVVWVAPAGARAASAGVFVTLAADVAAMAPGTHIGAAHPVQLGGLPIGGSPAGDHEPDRSSVDPTEEKIVADTAAWARSLAELRGRNAEWAERAVRESASVPASEALALGVVDLLAADEDELLRALDGRRLDRRQGAVVLSTLGAERREVEVWWGERLLAALCAPDVAFLLLIFGFYGVLFEIYTPGWGVAGTLGVVCLVLAFFGLAVLPINAVGLILLALALGLFVAEAFVTSYGALTLAGAACLLLGGLMLVDSPPGFLRVSWDVLLPATAATATIAFFLLGAIVRARRNRVTTGSEGLIGEVGAAVDDFVAGQGRFVGTIRVHGELWRAECAARVGRGQLLVVTGRLGLTLHADPAPHPEPVPGT